jgi:hypothetical protein
VYAVTGGGLIRPPRFFPGILADQANSFNNALAQFYYAFIPSFADDSRLGGVWRMRAGISICLFIHFSSFEDFEAGAENQQE